MNKNMISLLNKMDLPDEVKEDTVNCIEKVMKYHNDNNDESLLEWKNAYALAFTTLKTYRASHKISPSYYDTLLNMIRL